MKYEPTTTGWLDDIKGDHLSGKGARQPNVASRSWDATFRFDGHATGPSHPGLELETSTMK